MLAFPSETLATTIAILALTALFFLLRRLLPVPQPAEPFWIRLLLVLEPAIEFPVMFAFHPTLMAHDMGQNARLPRVDELILQVVVFFAVELAFQGCILRYMITVPYTGLEKSISVGHLPSQGPHYEEAERLVLDFVRPRGALLLAVALLGTPTDLNRYTGQLHPFAMVLWMASEQLVRCGSLEDWLYRQLTIVTRQKSTSESVFT